MAATIAKMKACDRMPFAVFTTSLDLRRALLTFGFQLPKSENSMRQLVLDQGDKVSDRSLATLCFLRSFCRDRSKS